MKNEYTEAVAGDGAAILKNGVPMTVSEILEELNNHASRIAEQGECFTEEEVMEVLSVNSSIRSPMDVFIYLNQRAVECAADKVADLQAWKESASKVLNNLDLQAIGKELGVQMGKDVSTEVLPGIKKLKEQMAGMFTEKQIRSALAGVCLSIQTQGYIIKTLKKIVDQIKGGG